jgi:branched-chain amino acid aminotransferase
MAQVYLNQRILDEEEARIPVNDRAILFGDGAYETMRSYSGKFFRFPEHLRRLRTTLQGLEIDLKIPDEAILAGATELTEANRVPDARLRLTVTGGLSDGVIRLKRSHEPNLIMTATALDPPSTETYRKGVQVLVSQWHVHSDSPLPRIKTINRLMHLMAKEEALRAGAWESLFCDEREDILEGTASNVFFVIDGAVRTAGLGGPILAGVTRDAILEQATEEGLAVIEGRVSLAEARKASEAFLSSTTIELLPISRIGDGRIGTGKPGPVWRRLSDRYRRAVTRETGVDLDPILPD